MRNPKPWSNSASFRLLKLGVLGISMVVVPLIAKPAFVGSRDFVCMAIPRVRATLSAWLTPAFLYVLLNCIIIAIVANSGVGIFNAAGAASTRPAEPSTSSPPQRDENEEKPKAEPEPIVDESSPVEETIAEPDAGEGDTLEATWEAITEARRPPPTRHLMKADTWETRRVRPQPPETATLSAFSRFEKSETWNSGRNLDRKTLGAEMLRKEPSLGQDELNKRVEAFIAKVNHDMKLQREESLLHYREMVDRGSG